MQLSQSCKHSESTDLLRKSLLPHVFTVSCEQERCLCLETYVSSIPYGIEKCKVEFVKMHKGFFSFRGRYDILDGHQKYRK